MFAEAAAALLAPTLGKAKAHELLATPVGARGDAKARDAARAAARRPGARARIDAAALDAAFDVDAAARRAGALAAGAARPPRAFAAPERSHPMTD